MFDCGCHDNDTSDALNMAFFVHSPSKPTTTQKNNGAFQNLFPTLLHCLQESLLTFKVGVSTPPPPPPLRLIFEYLVPVFSLCSGGLSKSALTSIITA